jgi:hypothetical protein
MSRFTPGICFAVLFAAPLPAAEPKVLFEDSFKGKLGDGWTWLKKKDGAWRIKDGALEIRVLPTQENVLARTVPDPSDGPYAIELTLTSLPQPTGQYEQVGLFWYANGKPGSKFVKELIDGKLYVFPGKKPMTEATVQLRLIVEGKKLTAQYRPGAKGEFLTAFTGNVPAAEKGKLQIALTCFHGPKDEEHWIRFTQFRIVKLPVREGSN